ncbi:MAG TPA: alpha/beta fold hydrolase, partial [Flavobacterium sp.]|nr:alpha/beta fold hydrolase [Flavobacterium sp.]
FFGVLYLVFLSYIYFNQADMIFQATKLPNNYKFNYQQKFEEISIPSFDNKKLHGLLFKAENPKGLVFYLHGNAGALDTWGDIATKYTSLGYDVFILDYRGFGKSEGEIENEVQFYKDISAAYKMMGNRYEERQIVIIGYSIGTGPAAFLASENKPAALVLQAPYFSLTELADSRMPLVPDFIKKFSFETHDFIQRIKAPVFIFHGNADQVIPFENSVRLSKLLKPSDRFFKLEGQGHGGMNDNQEYLLKLKVILDSIAVKNEKLIKK